MRPGLPPKFSLSTGTALALVLAALIAARTGYIGYIWEAAPISPAFADGRRTSGSHSEGESYSASSSSRSSEGGGSSYSGGGESSGSGRGEGGSGSSSSGSSGGDGGSSGYAGYSGYGTSPRSGDGYTYSNYGNSSGYTYSGAGSAHPHGDGKPPSIGVPQPELKGLPKELQLNVGKNSKDWEDLFKDKLGTHWATKEAEHASGAEREPEKGHEAKGAGEGAGHDRQKGWAPVKGGNSRSPGESLAPVARDPRSYSQTDVLAANLSPAGAARARSLGFQVGGPGHGPGAGPGGGPGGRHGGPGGVTVLTLPPGLDPSQGMRLLQDNLPGEHFQLNNIYRLYQPAMKQDKDDRAASVAVLGSKKCGGDRCYAQEAIQWKDRFSSCARNVKIGVIDTGFDLQHPAFKNQKIMQKAFMPPGKSAASAWHGTGVLALLAGRTDSGTPGLAPDATYHAASIFYADAGGEPVTDTVSFMKALDWMSESGARLVNMSFSGPQDELVQRKIEALSARGFVFTAAAGNNGPAAEPAYPAAYPQVIAVTAVTKDLKNYPYANRGEHIDIAAPGVDIWTAWPEAREGYRSGTSFASPFVTGVLALYPPDMLRGSKDSLLEHANIADLGPPGRDPIYGRGLLQAPPVCQGNASEVAELGTGAR